MSMNPSDAYPLSFSRSQHKAQTVMLNFRLLLRKVFCTFLTSKKKLQALLFMSRLPTAADGSLLRKILLIQNC
jgi:hypothetical protein